MSRAAAGLGDEWAVPVRFTQSDFDEFARLSGDDNPIHVDPAFSARSRFGRTVAHGMLLFSRLYAEVTHRMGGAPPLSGQTLMFPAPTFADVDLVARFRVVEAAPGGRRRIAESLETTAGTVTVQGEAILDAAGADVAREGQAPYGGPAFEGLETGMAAETERCVDVASVGAWCALVGDENPRHGGRAPEVPPPLLGGMISMLLGVQLPGPGTNWLKQRYQFRRPVPAGSVLRGRVEIVRLRPDKALVNLRTTCLVDGSEVVGGEALVLVPRSPR